MIMALFLIYVITWYMQLGTRLDILGNIRFEFLIAALLGALALLTFKKRAETPSGLLHLVVLFYLCCGFSFIFTPSIDRSWTVFLNYVIKYSFFSFFVYSFVKSPNGLRFFLVAIFLAWTKMGQEGLYGAVTGSMMWMNQGVMRLHGATGSYFHPNSFSGFAIGTLPFIYYYFPIVGKLTQAILCVNLVFALNIILHTGSRTGYVAFIGIIIYGLVKSSKKLKLIVYSLCLAVLIVPQIPTQYTERFESIISGKDKAGKSTEKRKEILRDAVTVFAENPLGVGVGAFPDVRYQRFGRHQDTHNLYLQIATNLGIQGLIVFSSLIFLLFRKLTFVINSAKAQLHMVLVNMQHPNDTGVDDLISFDRDLKLIMATAEALKMYIVARLILGIFGHDLFEIYWWFSIGITSSLFYIVQVTKKRLENLVGNI